MIYKTTSSQVCKSYAEIGLDLNLLIKITYFFLR